MRLEKRKQLEGGKASLDMQMSNGAKRQKSSDSWVRFENDEVVIDARARRGYEWSTGICTCVKE